jgi:formyltetrahydrofolate synthetase
MAPDVRKIGRRPLALSGTRAVRSHHTRGTLMSDNPLEENYVDTGVSNLVYDLASTMTDLLEGVVAMEQYRQDAA